VDPQESLYYLGGLALESLRDNNNCMRFVDLFLELNKKKDISISLFTLVLDWLFLVEAAEVRDDGMVIICF